MGSRPIKRARVIDVIRAIPLKLTQAAWRWLAELMSAGRHSDHGAYGVEAQFLDPVDVRIARTFHQRLDFTRTPREVAIRVGRGGAEGGRDGRRLMTRRNTLPAEHASDRRDAARISAGRRRLTV